MAERLNPEEQQMWYSFGWEHMQRYQFAASYIEGKSVLDVGCGIGYGTWVLAQYGPASVLGVDIDNTTIKQAKALYMEDMVSFKRADAQKLPLADASYDTVVSLENIEHLSDPPKFVHEAHRVLKPGGMLIISAPNTLMFKCGKYAIQNEFHLNEPTFEQLYDWISLKFCIRGQFEQSIVNKMDPSLEFEVYKQRRSIIFAVLRDLNVRP